MLYSRKQLLVTFVHAADHTNVATGTIIKRTVIHGIPIEKEEVAVNVTLIDQLRHPKSSRGGGGGFGGDSLHGLPLSKVTASQPVSCWKPWGRGEAVMVGVESQELEEEEEVMVGVGASGTRGGGGSGGGGRVSGTRGERGYGSGASG